MFKKKKKLQVGLKKLFFWDYAVDQMLFIPGHFGVDAL